STLVEQPSILRHERALQWSACDLMHVFGRGRHTSVIFEADGEPGRTSHLCRILTPPDILEVDGRRVPKRRDEGWCDSYVEHPMLEPELVAQKRDLFYASVEV